MCLTHIRLIWWLPLVSQFQQATSRYAAIAKGICFDKDIIFQSISECLLFSFIGLYDKTNPNPNVYHLESTRVKFR